MTPVCSIAASTSIRGISTSSMRRSIFCSFMPLRWSWAISQTRRASAAGSGGGSSPSSSWSPSATSTSLDAAARPRWAAMSIRS